MILASTRLLRYQCMDLSPELPQQTHPGAPARHLSPHAWAPNGCERCPAQGALPPVPTRPNPTRACGATRCAVKCLGERKREVDAENHPAQNRKTKKRALLTANEPVLRHVAVREAPAQHPPRHRGNASVQPRFGATTTPFTLRRQASVHKIIQLEHTFRLMI